MPIPLKQRKSAKNADFQPELNPHELTNTETNISEFIFNPNEQLDPEEIIISIQGKNVGSVGNCVVIAGKPKSRKSVVAHAMVASALSNKPILGIECNLPQQNSDIVLIDTEQAKHDLYNSLQRMKTLGELDNLPNNLKVYSFRKLDANGIKKAIQQILLNKSVRMIVIDGGLDLINNMNDVIESKQTIDFVKNLLDAHNICLVMIIHISKSTNFTVGHFGSFMDRFSQSVIEVTKLENGSSEIKAQVMRSAENFTPYEFYWNHNINNYSVNWLEPYEVTARYAHDLSEQQHKDILNKCFVNNEYLSYTALIQAMIRNYKKSETWAKKCIKHITDLEIIDKNDKGLFLKQNKAPF
jgi:hypothetical protein